MRSALLLCCLVEAPADRRRLAAYNYMEVDKLTAADAAAGDWFGSSVAIDGDTVVVGAYWDDEEGRLRLPHDRRRRHVRPGGQADGCIRRRGRHFGCSVAIDRRHHRGRGLRRTGDAAYVFRTSDGGATYGQVAKLTASQTPRRATGSAGPWRSTAVPS